MGNPKVIEDELDRLYKYEIDKYAEECNILKSIGYRIFRNPDGKHRVVEQARMNDIHNNNSIFNTFFGELFGGKNQ